MTDVVTSLRISAGTLSAAMARLLPLIDDSPTIPVLRSVQLQWQNGSQTLYLTAGTMQKRLTITVDDFESDGEQINVCLEAVVLGRLLATVPKTEMVVLTVESESIVSFSASSSVIRLPADSGSLYPRLDLDAKSVRIEIPSGEIATNLASYIAKAGTFTATNHELRPSFSGVWIDPQSTYLTIVGANDHAVYDMSTPITWEHTPTMIPYESVSVFVDSIAKASSPVIQVSPAWIGVSSELEQLWIRMTAPPMLNFASLWPGENDLEAEWVVDRLELIKALRRIMALPSLPAKAGVISHLASFATNDGSPVLSYNFEGYHLDEQLGDSTGDELNWPTGVGIDVRKMLLVANSFEGDELHFYFSPSGKRRSFYVVDNITNQRVLLNTLAQTTY